MKQLTVSSRAWYRCGRVEEPPHVPGSDGTIWGPFRANFLYPLRRRKLSQLVRPLNPFLHTKVQIGQNVWPAKPEHEKHLRRPPADSLDLRERRDDLLVRQLVERLDRHLTRCDSGAEVFEISRFL